MKNAESELTADDAKELLGVTTREGVVYMIKAGQLPGAHKASNKRNSAWLVPLSAIKAHPNYTNKNKRGQAAKAT